MTTARERAGAEGVIELIAARLDPARYTPVLATPAGGPLAVEWRARGWEVAGTPPFRQLRHLGDARRVINGLTAIIRDTGIDLVHTHGVAAQIHAGMAARRLACPVICHVHDRFEARWSADGLLHRLAARVPRAITIAVSQTVAASLAGRVPAAQLEIIPNGVEATPVEPVARTDRGPLVVWCGRLQRWKGAHLFLDAARQVLDARPDARFAVVGGTMFGMEPEYPQELKARAETLGLRSVLEFTGQVPDARRWLAAASVVVHCSVTPDPFPLVVLEAMMQSRPIVAFAQGGPAEAILDGETGRVTPPLDTAALAASIVGLLNQPDLLDRMGQAARRLALERYEVSTMVRRIEAAYDRVCRSRTAQAGSQ